MDWIIQLLIIQAYMEKEYIYPLIVCDGRCRGGVRLLFEDNLDSFVDRYMKRYPLVRYTIDRDKYRKEVSES